MLIENIKKAIELTKINTIVLAGGVSANSYIRKKFDELSKNTGVTVYYPELKLCTDNAAMIAAAGYYDFLEGKQADLTLNAIPNLKISE
jgi:N6-L-threonylcarbamoyladenine synthase